MSDHCHWLHEQLGRLPVVRFPFDESRLPENGVYIFYEDGEMWGHAGQQPRIVRIGSHRDGNFRSRIADHYLPSGRKLDLQANKPAPKDRSIFRKNLGRALLAKAHDPYLSIWDIDFTTRQNRQAHSSRRDLDKEREIEAAVSQLLRENFSFRYLELDIAIPRMGSKGLEAALIGTLAGCNVCKPSNIWLGLHSPKPKIRESGLWLVQHLNARAINVEDRDVIGSALTRQVGFGNLDSSMGDPTAFFSSRITNCLECNSDRVFFPQEGDEPVSGSAWRCAECGCAGSQTGCSVVITEEGSKS